MSVGGRGGHDVTGGVEEVDGHALVELLADRSETLEDGISISSVQI